MAEAGEEEASAEEEASVEEEAMVVTPGEHEGQGCCTEVQQGQDSSSSSSSPKTSENLAEEVKLR